MGNRIKRKWGFLLQCRPEIRSMMGNSKLIGGQISHSNNHGNIFNFIARKGTFTHNETTDEVESEVQIG